MTPANPSRRTNQFLLFAILLVAFLLRVYKLPAQSLWYDEGVTAWVARMPFAQMVAWTANDIQPPLYYAIVGGWGAIAGWSEFALRWVSVLFGMLTVPLLYTLMRSWQRRLGGDERAALWVALLAAIHPLLIYYAQEARMYALLGALVALGGWLLTPALLGHMAWRRWIGYAVTMALAAWTHYFAFFVLAAFGVAWLWEYLLRAKTQRSGFVRFVAANALVVSLFLPWLGVMFRRWGVDASYWQGQLKVWEAVRGVAQRFVTGETMREQPAVLMATAILLLTIVGLVAFWRTHARQRPLLRFALCWLILPVAAVILLASFAPKFNARYVYVALPGLLLVWGVLLGWATAPQEFGKRFFASRAVALLLLPLLFATASWYWDGAFAKAQWRELTEYLRPRLTEEERVILVSGHALPVWEYYAPDIEPVRLPEIDVLDVDEVLTFANTAQPLRAALETHPGAWLVGWQDEVVDPNQVVSTQLELGGREKGSSATFTQLTLDRFSQIRIGRISDTPPISATINADFGGQVVLDGYRPLDNGDLLLFWHLPQDSSADYHFALDVLDGNGNLLRKVSDRRLAGYNDPTFRWNPRETKMGRVSALEWLGFTLADHDEGVARPEPSYQLQLRVYDATTGSPLEINGGDSLTIDNVHAILE